MGNCLKWGEPADGCVRHAATAWGTGASPAHGISVCVTGWFGADARRCVLKSIQQHKLTILTGLSTVLSGKISKIIHSSKGLTL